MNLRNRKSNPQSRRQGANHIPAAHSGRYTHNSNMNSLIISSITSMTISITRPVLRASRPFACEVINLFRRSEYALCEVVKFPRIVWSSLHPFPQFDPTSSCLQLDHAIISRPACDTPSVTQGHPSSAHPPHPDRTHAHSHTRHTCTSNSGSGRLGHLKVCSKIEFLSVDPNHRSNIRFGSGQAGEDASKDPRGCLWLVTRSTGMERSDGVRRHLRQPQVATMVIRLTSVVLGRR